MPDTTEVTEALHTLLSTAKNCIERMDDEFLPLLDPAFEYIRDCAINAEGENGKRDSLEMAYIASCLQVAASRFGAGLVITMGQKHIESALQHLFEGIMREATEPID